MPRLLQEPAIAPSPISKGLQRQDRIRLVIMAGLLRAQITISGPDTLYALVASL